jgi:hypothetical protein
MKKSFYVQRLRKMLSILDGATCDRCPMFTGFTTVHERPYTNGIYIPSARDNKGSLNTDICVMCRDFVDVDPYDVACPCSASEQPISRALSYIELWDNGEHKWQLMEKK